MDTADRAEPEAAELKKGRLREKIAALKEQMQQLKIYEAQMRASPDQQLSLTDPDARSMKSRDGGIVGYNVQAAVDAKHHLIVAHEVITEGVDRNQLTPMAEQARAATGIEALTVVADRGYFKGEQILDCEQAGITPILPKALTSNSKADGRFDKQDFVYIAANDEYRCPAGQRAIKRFTTIEHGMTLNQYWSSACPRCPLKAQCTTSDYRRITRWEHEAVLEAMQQRLDRQPEMMRVRRQTDASDERLGRIGSYCSSSAGALASSAHKFSNCRLRAPRRDRGRHEPYKVRCVIIAQPKPLATVFTQPRPPSAIHAPKNSRRE